MDRLCDLVEEDLANKLDITIRLQEIESGRAYSSRVSAKLGNPNGSVRSTIAKIEQLP